MPTVFLDEISFQYKKYKPIPREKCLESKFENKANETIDVSVRYLLCVLYLSILHNNF